MIELRPFGHLRHATHGGWLDTRYHFSFSDYYDPDRMGWGRLRVWNDDWIGPHSGFPPHPHRNMEIITFVRSGTLSHKDSMGNIGHTDAGNVQVMSAGNGIVHAEYNMQDDPETNFQLWIESDQPGGDPYWELRQFPQEDRAGHWVSLASGSPEKDNALPIRADAKVLAATLKAGERLTYRADPARHQYLVPNSGRIRINNIGAETRDGVAITGENMLTVEALDHAELVMVDSR
ncbi:pirin family protein [Altericroceibacterium spongiae]|uniref:Pirin family protein n=1 Tax=Altericroceibacterium spongiae TaxID=2320269 RepID=A0A420ERC9_9SPHN|nr:pirin-like bicupin family protein [Altericroceibacterium spongiae]RKF23248.1 pirin family protein [Altericroceibacterium spongiae]